jgi:hypothetical protein
MAFQIFLPSESFLYMEEVDQLVSQINENPSAFIPYLAALKKYDAADKGKLNKAIKKVEEVDKPETPFTFSKPNSSEQELTSQERAMYGMDTKGSESTSKRKTLTAQERAMYGMDAKGSEVASYASATESPYKLSHLEPSKSPWSSPETESPIQWFKNLKPYDESADVSYARPYESEAASYAKPSVVKESPSHWKTLSNYVKLSNIIPFFKREEEELDASLLDMQEITDLDRAMRLVKSFPADIRFVHPSIYTKEMIQIVLNEDPQRAIFIDKSNRAFIEHMMPQFLAVPNIFDYIVLDDFLTERDLYELGVRTRFSQHDITRAIRGQRVYVHALCHGELIEPIKSPQKITRYSSIPLGVCEMLSSLKMSVIRRTTTYENFVEKNVEHIGELIQRTHYSEDNPRYVAVKKLMGVVPKKTFEKGNLIMNKIFSSLDVTPWHLNFLDIVTPTGKFNLFSLQPEWRLDEISAMFPGKEIVLCDYSCSKNEGRFTQDILETTGGKRTKRKRNRRNTKRRF